MPVIVYVDCEETNRESGADVFQFEGSYYHAITLNPDLKLVLEHHLPKRKIAVVRFNDQKKFDSYGGYEFVRWLDPIAP
jgi:hypothetical protein